MASDADGSSNGEKRTLSEFLIGPARNVRDPNIFHNLSLIAFLAWVGLGSDGLSGSVATLKTVTEEAPRGTGGAVSGRQIEQLIDELILLANIIVADPPRLPLADHVHGFVSFNRSLGCSELAKALLGLHSSFDRSMILLQDVVQVLDRSMPAAVAQGSFRFHRGNRRAVEAGLIGVDDTGLRMRWIAERLAE